MGFVEIKEIIERMNPRPNNYADHISLFVACQYLTNAPSFEGEKVFAETSVMTETAACRPLSKQSSCTNR